MRPNPVAGEWWAAWLWHSLGLAQPTWMRHRLPSLPPHGRPVRCMHMALFADSQSLPSPSLSGSLSWEHVGPEGCWISSLLAVLTSEPPAPAAVSGACGQIGRSLHWSLMSLSLRCPAGPWAQGVPFKSTAEAIGAGGSQVSLVEKFLPRWASPQSSSQHGR